MGPVPQATDGEMELLVQFFEVATHDVPQLDMLEVIPTAFVPRVQIGGIVLLCQLCWNSFRHGHELTQ